MNRRVPIALPGGLAVALALFALMTALIVEDDAGTHTVRVSLRLETARIVADAVEPQPPPRPDETPRVPPGRPGAPPSALSIPAPPLPSAAISLPDLGFQPKLVGLPQTGNPLAGMVTGEGFGTGAGENEAPGEGFEGRDLVPISTARPKYPRSAAERGIEGWVDVVFRISGDGQVTDIRVLDAEPRGVFEDAAVAAVARWVYAPFRRNGQPLQREAIQRLDFRTADIQPLYIWED